MSCTRVTPNGYYGNYMLTNLSSLPVLGLELYGPFCDHIHFRVARTCPLLPKPISNWIGSTLALGHLCHWGWRLDNGEEDQG